MRQSSQLITRNIRKPGKIVSLNFYTFTQNSKGLISWNFEIPAYAYCKTLCTIALYNSI
jgi:hypothetical protein